MTVYAARLSKAQLQSVPPEERSLFLSIAHLVNEINALHKLVLWASDFSSGNEVEVHGQVSLTLMLLKLLAGKLKEGHKLLRKRFYGTAVSRDYEPSLRQEGRDALAEIKKYFGRSNNNVNYIRNNYAFHYSPDELDAVLPHVPEDLELYVESGGSANNLYYFAEVLAGRALLRSMGASDDQAAYRQLVEEIPKVARWFAVVCDSLMTEFLRRHAGGIWEGKAVEVPLGELPPLLGVRLPWFTDTSDVHTGAA
ncbi:MAG: hypothetical protein U9R11_01990 [Chloroflexota bacterium]|nr:hypothetical protein [Chloroflexota bacterium]